MCHVAIGSPRWNLPPVLILLRLLCLCLGFMHTLAYFMDVLTTPISHFNPPLMCSSFCQSAPAQSPLPALCSLSARLRCSADASHCAHVCCFFLVFSFSERRKKGCSQVCFTAEGSPLVGDGFFSHSSSSKMFCAQHIWESKQM